MRRQYSDVHRSKDWQKGGGMATTRWKRYRLHTGEGNHNITFYILLCHQYLNEEKTMWCAKEEALV
ncbi:hypothetical protein KP509_14G010500 [Ceratopteris richardii]|uniref:Uncharacterized protein n=1 Tax=Ceratopteris richardii TaxID=49495 RepID=A0A8T2TA79_CERRI|nr:hypothetical protein KP509_14G010500 [Ceratopteris richardii]